MPIDYKQYHPKWSLIRRLVLKRAGNCCEECGAANHKPHPITGSYVVLTVAHANRDRRINRFWNLRAWCQRCHLRHDLFQRIFSFKYGKETQYVCGKLF